LPTYILVHLRPFALHFFRHVLFPGTAELRLQVTCVSNFNTKQLHGAEPFLTP